MDWYTAAWLGWLGFFVVVEGRALLSRRPGATLSEHVWAWFGVGQRPTAWVVLRRLALAVFLLWLLLHLVFGWLTPTHPLPWMR